MAAKTEPENPPEPIRKKTGVYIDSVALAKIYVPETETEQLEEFLRRRQDLMISELCITEVTSAAARRKREGLLNAKKVKEIHDAMLEDAKSRVYRHLDITAGACIALPGRRAWTEVASRSSETSFPGSELLRYYWYGAPRFCQSRRQTFSVGHQR